MEKIFEFRIWYLEAGHALKIEEHWFTSPRVSCEKFGLF